MHGKLGEIFNMQEVYLLSEVHDLGRMSFVCDSKSGKHLQNIHHISVHAQQTWFSDESRALARLESTAIKYICRDWFFLRESYSSFPLENSHKERTRKGIPNKAHGTQTCTKQRYKREKKPVRQFSICGRYWSVLLLFKHLADTRLLYTHLKTIFVAVVVMWRWSAWVRKQRYMEEG